MRRTCDVLIIGAGSAGCTLAGRLSADPTCEVLLLEAGRPDRKREIVIPAAFSRLYKTSIDWDYETEPQAELGGRRLYWPRGKVLGGSSSINAMIYIRGHRAVYDGWRAEGCEGWGWRDLLPLFLRSEAFHAGASPEHGDEGPLRVSAPMQPSPISEAFVEAAAELGFARNPDFNGARQEGFGLFHLTQKKGRRWSAADAFLKPALGRPNLRVETGALVLRILFDGARAIGVEYVQDGSLERVEAGEVVLSAGAVNSPQLLLLSGVGPAGALEALGLPVVADLPVGENLQDHLCFLVGRECRQPITLDGADSFANIARYLVTGRGPLTSNVGEAGGFVRIDPTAEAPDLQFHFAPAWFVNHGFDNPEGHGLSLGPTLVRPASRGRLSLASTDPTAPPRIDPAYLSEREDVETMIDGVRLARRILAASALEPFAGEERFPGPGLESREELESAIRRQIESIYHPVGTCRMGRDERSVVDPNLRVRGLDGLRVADASVMPTIPNGNTNAPAIMIGEKASELLRNGSN